MSGYVIRYLAPAGILVGRPPPEGAYLESYDVDAKEGFGEAHWTVMPGKAMVFESMEEAYAAWRSQSKVRPKRFHDGKPNRPLTCYTIWVEPAP